jgi:hypothetical protein
MTDHGVDRRPALPCANAWYWTAAVALTTLVVIGCGPNRPVLEGAVTLDGVPIDAGAIELFPADGKGPTAGTGITAGRYRTETTAGLKRVRINYPQKDGTKMLDPGGSGQMVDRLVEAVPDRYNEKTSLEVTIKPGLNKHDFTLEGSTVGNR